MSKQELLDFSVYSDADRNSYIHQRLSSLGRKPTQKELDLFANYILYGKNPTTGNSVVDEGFVSIPTKYNSYAKKESKVVSLDELQESPTFDERALHPLKRSIYKSPRQELDKSSPELEGLRIEIDKLQERYDAATSGTENTPHLSTTELYHLKHQLIALRSQQYIIKDATSHTVEIRPSSYHSTVPELEIEVWPLGLKMGDDRRFTDPLHDTGADWFDTYGDPLLPTNRVIDFTNPHHIYFLIEAYMDLLEAATYDALSDEALLVETLDWYAAEAHLLPSRFDIYTYKKYHYTNKSIREYINSDYNTKYNENYISTIFTHNICPQIAEAAKRHYIRWTYRKDPRVWKKCAHCGQWKLRDGIDFTRKTNSIEGFAATCKACEREKRQKAKFKSKGGKD